MPRARESRARPASIFVLALALLLAFGAAPASALPVQFSAGYEVTHRVFGRDVTLASAGLRLTRGPDDRYHYTFNLNPVRLIAMLYAEEMREVSRGSIPEEGVRPDLYSFVLEGRKPRADNIVFEDDEAAGVVRLAQNFKGDTVRQRVPAGTVDRMAMQLAVVRDVAAGKRAMQYLMADNRRLRVYRFEVVGTERVDTPLGEVDALRVELTGRLRVEDVEGLDVATMDVDAVKTPPVADEDRLTFWCASEFGYLPVRIQHVDDDLGTFRMNLRWVELPGQARRSAGGASR